MLQVAGGILIASVVIGLIVIGITIALNNDRRVLGDNGIGWWLAGIGTAAALAIFYFGSK